MDLLLVDVVDIELSLCPKLFATFGDDSNSFDSHLASSSLNNKMCI